MVEQGEHLLGIALGKPDQCLAFHDPLGLLEGRLDHELVQRRALDLRRLFQSVPEFRRNAAVMRLLSSTVVGIVSSGLVPFLPPVYHPDAGKATGRWNPRNSTGGRMLQMALKGQPE